MHRIAAALVVLLAACGSRDVEPPAAPDVTRGEAVYRVRDSGLRCVTHPCFHLAVTLEADGEPVTDVSRVDLSALPLTSAQRDSLADLLVREGFVAAGEIVTEPEAGPAGDGLVFRVRRLVP